MQTTSQIYDFSLFYKLTWWQGTRTLQPSKMLHFLLTRRKMWINQWSVLFSPGRQSRVFNAHQISPWIFFFLDFVSIFAKTGDESINCEIWLQSSDMGVRSDLGDYHLVCGYTCYVVVKATESSWRSTRAGPFREGPVRAGWCGQALWSARGLVSLRVTRPGRVDSICCAVSSTDGQLGALEELLSTTPGRTALLLRGQASVSSE